MSRRGWVCLALVFFVGMGTALAQTPRATEANAPRQTEEDDYTRYELLAPDTAKFRIYYDVTATTPGATFYFNPIRRGSEASDEAVVDAMTGAPLKFEVVSGAEAKRAGHPAADAETSYIKIQLPRAVPRGGGVRLRIDKTYRDPKTYYREGDRIVFSRSLGIKRNALVLPAGYELIACNYPSQVLREPDGRIKVSFMNGGPDAVSYVVKARPLPTDVRLKPDATAPVASPTAAPRAAPAAVTAPQPAAAPSPERSARLQISERAGQDREIVYFLLAPETHRFSLYHDYTESREGVDKYLNVVRRGSTVSNPTARILDTGEPLKMETLKGEAISKAGLDIGEAVQSDSEVVVIRFPAVKKGQSVRLRIEETYTDPNRYGLVGDELVWHRAFGRPRNAIVLPAGWMVTTSSIPSGVTETDDGRVRLDYVNARPDEIDVLVKARRR